MQRTLVCICGAALLSAMAAGAAETTTTHGLQHSEPSGQMRTLSNFSMNPAQKSAAGYDKLDNSLAGIARTASSVPANQVLSALKDSAQGVRFNLSDPLIVPGVLADIQIIGDAAAAKEQLRQLGASHISVFSNLISAYVPVDRLTDAAALGGVRFMRASRAQTHVGSVTTQGDFIQHSDLLRLSSVVPGLTGSGVTVGVLSDSFACTTAIKSYADDVASGDLPPDVEILEEYYNTSPTAAGPCDGAADEGRGMAQIVYDVAPGTKLKFYTAFVGEADFANGILALAAAGAKVIVDDVGYFDEPLFQDGIVAQAVDQVNANGVAYFSSAGNSGHQSFEATYKDSGTVGTTGADNAGEKLMAFTSADGKTTQNWLPFSVPGGFSEQSLQILEWDQPYVTGAPHSGGATSSLDICVTDSKGVVIKNGCSGANPVGGDPVSINGLVTDGTTTAYGVQVGLVGGTPPPGRIKIIFADDGQHSQAAPAFATYSSTVQGHPAAAGAMAVGASYFRANPVCNPGIYLNYTLEDYSSAGGTPTLFDVTGAKLATPVTRQKPNVVAPDGGNTTFFAQQLGFRNSAEPKCINAVNSWNFFGTSAAAPHAAGVAALLLQAQPAAAPDLIYKALQDSALVDMASISPTTKKPVVQSAVNFDTGYGYVRADQALAHVLPALTVSASQLTFGSTVKGSSAPTQTVTLTSGGPGPLTLGAITLGGAGFSQTNNCPAVLAAAATCTITVGFMPTDAAAYTGSVSIPSNAPSQSQTQVALSGTGTTAGDGGAIAPMLLLSGLAAAALRRRKRV
jgi:hypothetical protein